MNQMLKEILRSAHIYWPLRNAFGRFGEWKSLRHWRKNGRPVPPPHIVKQRVLKTHALAHNLKIFVETGTYLGDMVEAMKTHFARIYSIELDPVLFKRARERFRNDNYVTVLRGDSGICLKEIVQQLDKPSLFWLDGHYSGGITARGETDTPILSELACILGAEDFGHVVIIDDARCFGADPAYPHYQDLQRFIKLHRPHAQVSLEDDMIRILPPGAACKTSERL
jgi:hypothetical protein